MRYITLEVHVSPISTRYHIYAVLVTSFLYFDRGYGMLPIIIGFYTLSKTRKCKSQLILKILESVTFLFNVFTINTVLTALNN